MWNLKRDCFETQVTGSGPGHRSTGRCRIYDSPDVRRKVLLMNQPYFTECTHYLTSWILLLRTQTSQAKHYIPLPCKKLSHLQVSLLKWNKSLVTRTRLQRNFTFNKSIKWILTSLSHVLKSLLRIQAGGEQRFLFHDF